MNNEKHRSNKIKELKMKAQRKDICRKLDNIINDLRIDSFISIEDTIAISKKVYKKINILINTKEIEKDVESNLIKVASLKEKYKMDTASWGSLKKAKQYRQKQKELIEQGKFKEAQQLDIDDVRSKFKDKYDDAIEEMKKYTDELLNKGK